MKKAVMTLAVIVWPVLGFAQGITVTSGSAMQVLSEPSGSFTADVFDLDSAGDIVYMGEAPGNAADTEVIKATAASDYNTLTPIVDYGTSTTPAFVRVSGTAVYYGDSVSNGYVNGSNLTVNGSVPAPHQIAMMQYNYDMAITGTTAVVSANISTTNNEVYTLDLSTGVYKPLLNTGGDYSGPVAFDSAGDLIYGATGFSIKGIYIFSKAKWQNAIDTDSTLTLSDTTGFINDTGNSGFAIGANNELYDAFAPATGDSLLYEYNLSNLSAPGTLIGTAATGDSFSSIQFYNGHLYVGESDYSSFTDIYEIVPEPGVTWLGMAGLGAAGYAGRRRLRRRVT